MKKATKSEKIDIAKTHLDNIYNAYENFTGLIPDVEKRVTTLEKELDNEDLLKRWKDVLKHLKHVRDRPKAMKLYYAKRVTNKMGKLRKKYPGE